VELADLVDRPFLRQGREGVGSGARAVIVDRRRLVTKPDDDGQRDLLDRREAVELVGADVPRQVEQLVGGEVGGGDAVKDLLIGGIGRLGRAAVLADQRRDGRVYSLASPLRRIRSKRHIEA
jgi:hypothetical protein